MLEPPKDQADADSNGRRRQRPLMTGCTSAKDQQIRGRTWQAFPLSPLRTPGQVHERVPQDPVFHYVLDSILRMKSAPWPAADSPPQTGRR